MQAKTAGGEKKKQPSEWARGRGGKKKTAVCVCECVVFIPALSRSLSICVLQARGTFEWVSACVYVAEFAGVQSKRCV